MHFSCFGTVMTDLSFRTLKKKQTFTFEEGDGNMKGSQQVVEVHGLYLQCRATYSINQLIYLSYYCIFTILMSWDDVSKRFENKQTNKQCVTAAQEKLPCEKKPWAGPDSRGPSSVDDLIRWEGNATSSHSGRQARQHSDYLSSFKQPNQLIASMKTPVTLIRWHTLV